MNPKKSFCCTADICLFHEFPEGVCSLCGTPSAHLERDVIEGYNESLKEKISPIMKQYFLGMRKAYKDTLNQLVDF